MQLEKLKISNFRQFEGDNVLEFGYGQQNVTLIKGTNGAGKTGIFRAIMFALYGDHYLEQDTTREDIHLVNSKLLNSTGLPMTATVTLYFRHNDVSYLIKRSLTEFKSDNKTSVATEGAEFGKFLADKQQYQKITDNIDQVRVEVNNILPQNIRKFFFFDAEKLDLLSGLQNGGSVAKSIKTGVFDLLQLSNLETASKVFNQAARDQSKELSNQLGDQQFKELEDKIETTNNDLSRLREEKSQIIDEIETAKKEEELIKQQIAQNRDDRAQAEILKNKEETLSSERYALNEVINEAIGRIDDTAIDVVLGSVDKAGIKVENIQNQRSDKFAKAILTESLNNKVCALCGNDLSAHPENEEHIQVLLKKFQVSEISGVLNIVSNSLMSANSSSQGIQAAVTRSYQSIVNHEDKINKLEHEIEQIGSQITMSQNELKNITNKEQHTLPNVQSNISTMTEKIGVKKDQITKLENKLQELEAQQEQVQIKDNNLKVKRDAVARLKRIGKEIDQIIDTYSTYSKEQLEKQMKVIFNQIITAEDRSLISDIKISNNFELSVIGKNGMSILNDISMGQSQMLSLAFITALATVASKGRNNVDFPLFMDTPFGRLDVENRTNLIKNIPNMTSQWVLLVTDTELTEGTELPVFKQENRVGKVYSLNKMDDGTTKIVPEEI